MESFHACVSPQDFHTEAKEPELPLCLSPVSQGTAAGTAFLPYLSPSHTVLFILRHMPCSALITAVSRDAHTEGQAPVTQ